MEYNVNVEYLFTVQDENGNDVKCDSIAVVTRTEGLPIIIYTDYTKNEEGKYNTYASGLRMEDGQISLEEISENEIKLPLVQEAISVALENLQSQMSKKEEA